MSKCHVKELLQVVHHLFEDFGSTYPALVDDFVKDERRLRNFVECRGVHALCVDLVAAGKHFDRCLSEGKYKLSGLPLTKRYSGRVVIPKFLRGLYLLVFDEAGNLKEDCEVEAILFIRQILFVGKKVALACSDDQVLAEVESFFAIDRTLPEPEGFWRETRPEIGDVARYYQGFASPDSSLYLHRISGNLDSSLREEMSILLKNLDAISRLFTTTLGPYDPSEWRFRHGPGAISERTGPTNKYYWSNWSDRLENAFPIADYGFHSFSSWADRADRGDIGSSEPASRLISVPKTFTKPRLIAAEPSEHQWCQQNLWHYFLERTRRTWLGLFIKFDDQTFNQEKCLKGSVDGSLATVDLSAASDRVTCHIVGQFFRVNPRLLLALQSTRTRFLSQSINPSIDELTELRKFSTMGSACTFPVQSLLFLATCLAAVATKRRLPIQTSVLEELHSEVAVFGDDLIIPSDSRDLLFAALEVLHFKVNDHKSFWSGNFRESCGVDAFRGCNVTPVYWRAPKGKTPESIVSALEVRNNFYSKFYSRTAEFLTSAMRAESIPYVRMGSGVCGFKTFTSPPRTGLTRWNESLYRAETSVTTFTSRQQKTPVADDSALLQYFTERPSPFILWRSGVMQRASLRKKKRWVPLEDIYDK